jgi:uncharacterized protein (TIGR03382 family)
MARATPWYVVGVVGAVSGVLDSRASADVTFYQFDQARFRILGYFDAAGNTLPGQPADMFVTAGGTSTRTPSTEQGGATADSGSSFQVFGRPLGAPNSRAVLTTWAEGLAPSGGSFASARTEAERTITFLNASRASITVMCSAATYSFDSIRGGNPLLESGHVEGWAGVNIDGLGPGSHTHTDYVPGGRASDPSGAYRTSFSVAGNGGVFRVRLSAESEGWGRTLAAPAPGTSAMLVLGAVALGRRRRA